MAPFYNRKQESAGGGTGDVSKVGTPVNNQVVVWTGDGTIEGDTALTFDTTTDTLSSGTFLGTSLTASELTATDASKNIVSLPVASYPSLAETAYVKGVTSAIQTQLNGKQASMGADDNYVTDAEKTAIGTISGKENVSNKENTTLDTSTTKYPTNRLVKEYADGLVVGLLDDRGSYDASVNTFPASGGSGTAGAILKGDLWYISVAGTLGGVAVAIGDSVRALSDTPGQTATNWSILEANIGYVPENVVNKVTSISGASTDTQYPSAKLAYDQLALKAPLASPTFTGTVTLPKTLEIQDTSADHQYVLAVSELTADRTVTLPLLTGNDEFVFKDHIQTLTNKRITERVVTTTDDATAVIDVDVTDVYELSAVANATTFSTTGTPTNGQKLIIRFKDAGVAKGLTWDAIFVAIGVTAPSTTVAGKWTYLGFKYNSSAGKFHCLAVATEA